ncbi:MULTISPECIES: amino acid ABC transporter permease [Streptococcus]|uniref:Amino acid ABC transporter permease n=1 Tax=Streptococcus caledonicus TaxID=2614158 RepID=A0ABW0UE63_9STRE|nr:amino acid ABC transporter permease [Streptococcus sp. S784/96/1]
MALTTAQLSPWALERWSGFIDYLDEFALGFLYTLGIATCALLLALALGTGFAMLNRHRSFFLRLFSRIYVEVFQNTPLLVHFVFLYYGLAIITDGTIRINTFFTAVICVGLYHGAYIAEVIRSGIESVPKGQTEAALSQGFSQKETMWLIILPQAIRSILPPLTNQVVNLIKNTATVAIISGADVMFTAKNWAYDTSNYVPAFASAALLYFIMCFPIASWGRRIEAGNKKAYHL